MLPMRLSASRLVTAASRTTWSASPITSQTRLLTTSSRVASSIVSSPSRPISSIHNASNGPTPLRLLSSTLQPSSFLIRQTPAVTVIGIAGLRWQSNGNPKNPNNIPQFRRPPKLDEDGSDQSSSNSKNPSWKTGFTAKQQEVADSELGSKSRKIPGNTNPWVEAKKARDAEYAKEQQEFDGPNSAEANRISETDNLRTESESRTGQPEFSNEQPEFAGPKSAEANEADVEDAAPSKPQKPLPDLRYGIPSTFEQEYLKSQQKPSEGEHMHRDIDITDAEPEHARPGAGAGGSKGDGEIPKSAYESSIDKRRNRMATYFYISMALFASAGALWAGRDWESEEEARRFPDAPSGWGFMLFYNRIQARIKDQLGYYTEPAFPKLLPTMTDQPTPPYTLVISLEDMLVHSEWSREHGWRTAKRPGVDFFLLYLSQYYELCLFTSVSSGIADPVFRKLDPYHLIQWPLFREATRYENGKYIKDLSYLNRPLERTILVDTHAEHASAQPENAIILKPWNGDPSDRELLALVPFLEYIAIMGIEDVRGALKSFEGTHIPTEFAQREARMRQQYAAEIAAAKAAKKSGSGFGSFFGGLIKGGQPPDAPVSIIDAMAEGKTMFDVMRDEGMKRYRTMEKEIRENGDKWLHEEAELIKRMEAEQMKNVKSNPLSIFGIGAKPIDPQVILAEAQAAQAAAASNKE